MNKDIDSTETMSDNTDTDYSSDLEEKEYDMDIFTNYKIPIVFKLPRRTDSIPGHTEQRISSNIDYPIFTFGFQHYLHANKENFSVADQFIGKKPVYNVVSKFNKNIDNHETDIESMCRVYFDSDPKPHMLNDDFYKYWELFFMFDIVPTSSSSFISHHYGEGIGSSAQAVMLFRDKFASNTNSDKYTFVSSTNMGKHVDNVDKKFLDYYKREKKTRVNISSEPSSHDLATVTCGTNWEWRNLKEQDSFNFLVNQIDQAINTQKNGGSLICKVFETYTLTMNKLLYLLTGYYDQVFVVKPLTSNNYISEKFIVCLNFNGKAKSLSKFIVNRGFLVDIFPDLQLPKKFVSVMRQANTDISNRQLIDINKMITFIEENNYYGNLYQHYRSDQIEANKYWISRYLTAKYSSTKKEIEGYVQDIIKSNKDKIDELSNKLT